MDEKNLSNAVCNNETLQQPNQQQQQQQQQQQHQSKLSDASEINVDECLLCSEQKRDTVFKPCGHVVSCEACGSRIKKCLICRETVASREKVSSFRFNVNFHYNIHAIYRLTSVSFAPTEKLPSFSSLAATWWRVKTVHQS